MHLFYAWDKTIPNSIYDFQQGISEMPITQEMIEKNKERAIQRWTDITEFEMHQIREFRDSVREVEANSEGWEFRSMYPSKDIDDMTYEESMNFYYFITIMTPITNL